ncbi:MAG: hypothetical protein R3272_03890 [Candidatus Promineifilaceae bacterium]|nr:hypothetical protein [Candidatus Promineifilaceae bacterium]
MDSFHFGQEHGRKIQAYESAGATVVGLLRTTPASVVTIYLDPGGIVGMHPAAADQLFLVVAGGGWATAGGEERELAPGTAVLWRREEVHETRAAAEGLTAVVVEGAGLVEALVPKVRGEAGEK